MVSRFYVQEHPKAQRAVVLVLKRLRRQIGGLKSHLYRCNIVHGYIFVLY